MRALAQADEVYLGAVNRAEKLKEEERFDPEAVAQLLETQGVEAHTAVTNAKLLEKLVANTLPAAAMAKQPQAGPQAGCSRIRDNLTCGPGGPSYMRH